ncbi:MAG: class I SAM-dependent methyltransferase [bacterium]
MKNSTINHLVKTLQGYYSKPQVLKRARIPGEIIHSDIESGVIWDLAKKAIKPHGFALEVGTWKGNSGYIIASICAMRQAHLICIDSFNGDMAFGGEAHNLDFLRDHALAHLSSLPVSFLVMNSTQAHQVIADHTFDFCFVDGDHTEPVVSQDIKNYYSKVKPGGIYSGHDYGFVHADPKIIFKVKENVDKVCGRVKVIDTIWFRQIPNK